jgi:hypothetical protein
MATTVTTAITRLRERLDEPTAAQWTDVQLRAWLNEGIRDIARRTFHYTDTDTVAVTVPSTGLVTVPSDVIRINACYFQATADQTRKQPLQARAWDAMDNVWWDYQDRSYGDPVFYSVYGYAPTVTIKLYPVPSRAGNLLLHVARMPAAIDITSGTGNVDAPDAWLEVAYDYCEYMALRKDMQPRWQESKALYEEHLAEMIQNGDYLNAPDEFVWNGPNALPTWLVMGDGYGW